VPKCDDGGTTTIRGTVFSGALTNPHPIPGGFVYVPNIAPGTKLPPLPDGPFCDQCDPPPFDTAIVSALIRPDGTFILTGVPAGTGIPLVAQLGRWRRQIAIDVAPCTDNVLPAGALRLPRNKSEGDIPLTAIATGNADRMQCLLRKLGIDDAEFSNPSGGGRIHFYRANGAIIDANTPADTLLKGTTAGGGAWSQYSQVLLPCEGAVENETPEALDNFKSYVNSGGRVIVSHDSFVWLHTNGPFASLGTWTGGGPDPAAPLTAYVNTGTIRSAIFAEWLSYVGALSQSTPPNVILTDPHGDLGAVGIGGQRWLTAPLPMNVENTQLMIADTPVGAPPDLACGRVVFADFHAGSSAPSGSIFPSECDADLSLSTQDKLLEYMLFYLSGCMSPKTDGPEPPYPPPEPPPAPPKGPPPPPPPIPPPPIPCH